LKKSLNSAGLLYTLVDTAYLHGGPVAEVARQLCAGGADLIQLRAKESLPTDIQAMAEAILPVTRAAGVPFVINDHPEIARKTGAEYCHLGQEDFFDAGHRQASEVATPDSGFKLGLSTHAPSQAIRALQANPAYLAIGPVYPTGTKPTAKPVTLKYVRWAAANVPIPWFAIGGITLDNLDDVLAAGASRICVVSAILNAPDISAACRAFKRRLEFICPRDSTN
jgi:thiamine-phosphate pyrophosphorylase